MPQPVFAANSLFDIDKVCVIPVAATGFLETSLFDDRIFTTYKASTPVTTDIITENTTGTSSVDYFGMVGHDLFTQGASLDFASSPDNITYTTIFSVTPADDFIIFRTFDSVTDKFFRARITGQAAGISIGQIQWGIRVEPPFGLEFDGFDPQDESLEVRFARSQVGHILGAVCLFATRRARIRLPLIPDTFVRDLTIGGFQEFWDNHASLLKPFFVSWNPGNPGTFEKDSFFGVVTPQRGVRRPMRTPLDSGFRNIEFEVVGLKESSLPR